MKISLPAEGENEIVPLRADGIPLCKFGAGCNLCSQRRVDATEK